MHLKRNSPLLPTGLVAFASGSCGRVYKATNGSLWASVWIDEESIEPDGFAPVVEVPETDESESDYIFKE